MTTTDAPAKPDKIMQYLFSHIPTQALCSGIDLELFEHVEAGVDTVKELAEKIGADTRGLTHLVGALCAMGFLVKQDGKLSLAADTRMYLLKDSKAYLGGVRTQVKQSWAAWNHLTESVRTGQPAPGSLEEDRGEFFSTWVDSLFNLNFPAAQAAAERLASKARRVLDIAAGSGVWSLAVATRNPQTEVVVVDLPEVVNKVTRPFTQRFGVADRYSFLEEDLHAVDYGEDAFDLAILGHILHSEGDKRSRLLLEKMGRAVKQGGALLVAEMIPDEERCQDMFGNLFGLNMLVHTQDGTVYTKSELEHMVQVAGFSRCEWLSAPSKFPLLVAYKD